MRLSAEECRELARRAVAMTQADEAEAVVAATDSALTRFADNRIHQNVAETDTQLSVRAVVGTRIGVASTNRLDDAGVAACCERAVASARLAPEDPEFPGLPGPEAVATPDRTSAATRAFDAEARAQAVRAIIAPSARNSLVAAGTVGVSDYAVAVANSAGVDVGMDVTDVRATVLSMGAGPGAGSGWSSFLGISAEHLEPDVLGEQAAETALRTRDAGDLDPGSYTVLLAPDAVADLMDFLGYLGFGAKSFAEGTAFTSHHEGERLFSESLAITDDALASEALGLTFDFEGQPKRVTPLVESGVVRGPVTDSYYAAKLGRENTGHALPAPNPYGPMPLNVAVAPGDTSTASMIASVERGVYVSRFHYVNVEDPMRVVLTGMTRDGTFAIENGRLARPLKNLRFTQSALDALASVLAVSKERSLVGPAEGGATLVPALLLERWAFTGQTG
ncbi:MAG: TldD/PmbA family protein [Coriobacteriia bacterium]